MNSTDRQIDRALHALHAAAPRDGMDQRLLARLKDHAAAPASSWRPALTFAPPAAALLTASILFLLFHHAQQPAAPTLAGAAEQATQAIPQQVQPLEISPANHTFASTLPVATSEKSPSAAEIDPAYLPSYPAPAAPLTADERRLTRLAQHAATFDVAQLEAPPLAHRSDAIEQYIHHMLAPLVTAESFSPTPPVESSNPPAPQPEQDSNLSTQ